MAWPLHHRWWQLRVRNGVCMVMVSAVEPERSCRHPTAFTTMNTTTLRAAVHVARADWGPAIKTTARAVAAVAVACYVSGYTCYVAGYMLGAWVHRTSAALARYWVATSAGSSAAKPLGSQGLMAAEPPKTNQTAVPVVAPITPAVHPLAAIAGDLQALPAARLRSLTGTRSKRARKADLAALLVAC